MFAVMHFHGRAGMSPPVPLEVCSKCEVPDGAWVLCSPAWPAAWPCVVGGQPWGMLVAYHLHPPSAPHLEAPCPAQLGQEALSVLETWGACDHMASTWEGSAGDGHLVIPGGLNGRGRQSILVFICSMTTEEASQNVYKRILYSSRGAPPCSQPNRKNLTAS